MYQEDCRKMGNRSLQTLYRAITYFGHILSKRDFPIQHFLVFLYVSIYQRKTIYDIYTELGMSQATVSRIVQQLSKYRNKETGEIEGLDLLRTERDFDYPQRIAVTLTLRGERVKQELIKIMEEVEYCGSHQ